MSDATAPAPAFMTDDELCGPAPARRVAVQREHALQRGIARWAKRCLARPALFVAWDRSEKHSDTQHIREAARGIIGGWVDCGILWDGGFLGIELKQPGKKPTDRQMQVATRIYDAGHRWACADSVAAFAAAVRAAGIPTMGNPEVTARLQDAMVAADIRKQEARAGKVRAGAFKPRRGPRATPGQVARYRAAGGLA